MISSIPSKSSEILISNKTDGKIKTSHESYTPRRVFLHWSRGLFILLIGAFIGILIGGTTLLIAKNHLKTNLQTSLNPINLEDSTANWKTYTDTINNFSINYPSSIYLLKTENSETSKDKLPNKEIWLQINVVNIPHDTMYQAVKSLQVGQTSNQNALTRLANVPRVDARVYYKGATNDIVGQKPKIGYLAYFEKGAFLYQINLLSFDEIKINAKQTLFNHIISTFKLINTTQVIAPTSPISIVPIFHPIVKTGQHCGGNMTNSPFCQKGDHCAPDPAINNLPFGDVGGICVKE